MAQGGCGGEQAEGPQSLWLLSNPPNPPTQGKKPPGLQAGPDLPLWENSRRGGATWGPGACQQTAALPQPTPTWGTTCDGTWDSPCPTSPSQRGPSPQCAWRRIHSGPWESSGISTWAALLATVTTETKVRHRGTRCVWGQSLPPNHRPEGLSPGSRGAEAPCPEGWGRREAGGWAEDPTQQAPLRPRWHTPLPRAPTRHLKYIRVTGTVHLIRFKTISSAALTHSDR